MKKISVLTIIVLLAMGSAHHLWAGAPFKFPQRIQFKLIKNDNIVGECQLLYQETTDKKGISSLQLKNFQGLGLTSEESFVTYLFTDSSSIYAEFLLKGKEKVYEIRLKEGLTFELKKEQVFVYKEEAKPTLQTELFTQYPVIDLLSSFFVTSRRVALGQHKKTEKFNLIFDKSTKIAEMKYTGPRKEPFQGREVDTEALSITISNVEMFAMKIYKDKDGYCFPVSVTISSQGGSFEMRADRVSK
jgi:hypothetical protein